MRPIETYDQLDDIARAIKASLAAAKYVDAPTAAVELLKCQALLAKGVALLD